MVTGGHPEFSFGVTLESRARQALLHFQVAPVGCEGLAVPSRCLGWLITPSVPEEGP